MNTKLNGLERCYRREIASRLEQVDEVCREIKNFLGNSPEFDRLFSVELVARECLNNAILHGNRGNPRKKVALKLLRGPKWVRLQVADQGQGHKWRAQAGRLPEDECACHGRGLAIVNMYADGSRFNRRGNEITLWWRRAQNKKAR